MVGKKNGNMVEGVRGEMNMVGEMSLRVGSVIGRNEIWKKGGRFMIGLMMVVVVIVMVCVILLEVYM
uniref:hypothetical protein n=1 Tax=Bacillus pumilus TaxID=1408 RepID=UPI001C931433